MIVKCISTPSMKIHKVYKKWNMKYICYKNMKTSKIKLKTITATTSQSNGEN